MLDFNAPRHETRAAAILYYLATGTIPQDFYLIDNELGTSLNTVALSFLQGDYIPKSIYAARDAGLSFAGGFGMTSAEDGLHAAALVIEEDLRKIDAGEVKATPEQRAFLAGAVQGLKAPSCTESGGFPVDSADVGAPDDHPALQTNGADGGRPENTRIADRRDPVSHGRCH